jgi:hypothetical protein
MAKRPTCAQLKKRCEKNMMNDQYCAFVKNYDAAQGRRPRMCGWVGDDMELDSFYADASEFCEHYRRR